MRKAFATSSSPKWRPPCGRERDVAKALRIPARDESYPFTAPASIPRTK